VLLKKLPEKLSDTGRFLIPCDFYGLESCMALADLGASINLMPLSVWKKLSLLELTPSRMTLELATRTVAYPAGSPLLRTAHALVVIHREGLTLRVGDEKLVFNVESTLKYPRKHGDESIHKIDILDITCEDLFHKVLNIQKSINPISGSPTASSDPVAASLSRSLTPFEDSDFILEEIDTFLDFDESTSPDPRNIESNKEVEPKRVKHFAYHKEKMLLCKQAEKGDPLQAEQYDWLEDTDEEIDEQELEAHYIYMARIQEVPTADSGTDSKNICI
nr:reverse transcriptase domain-containing protein [Tanacetum cinerariifolium]